MSINMDKIKIKCSFINKFSTFKYIVILVFPTPPLFVYIKIFVKKQQKMSDHVRYRSKDNNKKVNARSYNKIDKTFL